MTSTSKTILITAITSVIFFVGGFAAGAISASIRIGETSHINGIRDDLGTLKSLDESPSGFERVMIVNVRTELLTSLCYRYEALNNQNKLRIRSYLAQYNEITHVRTTNSVLPAFNDEADYSYLKKKYCSLKP